MKIRCPALEREEPASVDNIAEIVAALHGREDAFAILEQDAMTYMQLSPCGEHYDLEYQEGSLDRHFCTTTPLRGIDAIGAMHAYLQGSSDWKTRLAFQQMAFSETADNRAGGLRIRWWQVLKSLFFPPRL